MMDVTLHPTPRWRDVLIEQIRIVRLSLVPAALVVAVVLAVGTVIIAGEIIAGGPGFDSRETFPTPLVAFLYPFAVWRSEKRFGPAFLWTFPVDRRLLALAKVFAGLVWFMATLAFFLLWLLALGLIAGASPANTVARIPFIATLAMYLFGSALVLGLRHPLRWLIGTTGLLSLVGTFGDAMRRSDDREWRYGARAVFSAIENATSAWLTLSVSAPWTMTAVLSLGLAAVWMAASRHREIHRHRKRQR